MTISNNINRKFLKNHKIYHVNFIYTSPILNSSNRPAGVDSGTLGLVNETLVNETLGNTNVNLSNLQLVKYREDPSSYEDQDKKEIGLTSTLNKDFSWLCDENGKPLNFNDPVNIFQGVKFASLYLSVKLQIAKGKISEFKLMELLDPFLNGQDVTLIELYNHIFNIMKVNKDAINGILKDSSNESNNNTESEGTNPLTLGSINKPFGQFGEITFNQAALYFKNLNWDVVLENTKVTVHAIPTAVNIIGFNLVLKSFVKHIYNRPFEPHLSPAQLATQKLHRKYELLGFAVIGAPLALYLIKKSAVELKNMASIEFSLESETQTKETNTNINSSSFFLFISNLYNKIPSWVKITFRLLLLFLLVLKLCGITLIDFLVNDYYLKIYFIFACSFLIVFHLIILLILQLFIKKSLTISEILPDFLINWLKDFEYISSDPESIKDFKKSSYRLVGIYIIILTLFTIFF